MNGHIEIRDLLALAAAGALDANEQRRVEEHLRDCVDCRTEFDAWCQITSGLRELPTPTAPVGLVERTRRQLANQSVARSERRWNRLMMASLITFGWALTLLSWPVLQLLGNKLVQWLDVPFTNLALVWIVYTVAAWVATGVAAAFLGKRHQQEGRTV